MRDAIFTPVSQQALARSAVETFGHSLSLSLNFHQGKQTGALARHHRPRRPLHRHPARAAWCSTSARPLFELAMAAYVMTTRYNWRAGGGRPSPPSSSTSSSPSASPTGASRHRRALNEADSRGGRPRGRRADELRDHQDLRLGGPASSAAMREAMGDYARAAVKSNTSLQMLNAIQSVVLSLGLVRRRGPGRLARCSHGRDERRRRSPPAS